MLGMQDNRLLESLWVLLGCSTGFLLSLQISSMTAMLSVRTAGRR